MDQSLGYIGAAILGAIIANGFQIYRDIKKDEKQKKDDKIRTISTLRGRKHTMLQLHASYYSAFIQAENLSSSAKIVVIRYVDYDQILPLRMSGIPDKVEKAQQYVNQKIDLALKKSLELKEGLRQKQRYEELQIKMAENDERFWITIARIKILFPNDRVTELVKIIKEADEKLGKLEKEVIESIEPIRREIATKPGSIDSNVNREIWCGKMMINLDAWITAKGDDLRSSINFLDVKIDDLLKYLEDEIINSQYYKDCNLFCSSNTCPLEPLSQEESKKKR